MFSLLTINGGSSSIRFAIYGADEPLVRRLHGKVDRIGQSGTNLTFEDSAGETRGTRTIDIGDDRPASAFLVDWLEAQPAFHSIGAVGHRVVHGMTHSKPERIRPKLLEELHRSTPYDPDHLYYARTFA